MNNPLKLFLIFLIALSANVFGQTTWTDKIYNPDVPDIENNPVKGWMPGYPGINSDFPYSIDHFYIPLNEVYTNWGVCDWSAFEEELDRIVQGGRHVVTRFFIDYPNRSSGMPEFLIDDNGYKVPMHDENSPYWNDDTLMVALEEFIDLFGEAYDGDPRIAFIEAGLYGYWGEWHTYPENDWAMTVVNKDRLLVAYDSAFDTTHIGLRQSGHASTYDLKMSVGYYDDSFAFSTLCSGSWCSWNGNIVPDGITDNYKYHPFAGELRPEIQSTIFDEWPNGTSNGEEDLETCIRTTHLSFMKAYYLFNSIPTPTEYENALRAHKMMGYEFFVSSVQLTSDAASNVTVNVNLQNRGVAPFYYNWETEFYAISSSGQNMGVIGRADWDITTILPDSTDHLKTFSAPIYGNDTYTILMRFVNPLEEYTENAKSLRFANQFQDSEIDGWLTLGTVTINADEVKTTGVAIENCPSDSIRAGEKYMFVATVEPFNATNKTIYWHSSDPAVASIDSLGEITAYNVGSTIITLYSYDSTLTDVCLLKVSDPAQWPFQDIARSVPGRIEAEYFDEGGEGIAYHDDGQKNGNTQFRPDVWVDFNTHEGASNDYVVGWTVDGEWLEYTIDVESGLYDITLLYHSGMPPGSLKVLLDNEELTTLTGMKNQGNWGIPATTTAMGIDISGGNNKVLKLENIGDGYDIDALDFNLHVDATGVSIGSCPSTDLAVGATHQLSANVEPANASDQSVSWISSNTDVATVNGDGRVTGVAEGTAIITITSNDGGYTDQCEITVFQPVIPVTGVALTGCPDSDITVDETKQLNVTVSPANADDPSVTWSSSDTEVATVDQNGWVTATAAGTVIISVITNDGDFIETCEIKVKEPIIFVTGVSITECPSGTLTVDSTYQLVATLIPEDASNQGVSWSSLNEDIASVDENGWVTAISAGETTISVTTDDGDFKNECNLTVEDNSNVGIPESISEGVSVFPNPASDRLNFKFPDINEKHEIRIFNSIGYLIYMQNTFELHHTINLKEITKNGLLLVHVQSGGNITTFKIIVKQGN